MPLTQRLRDRAGAWLHTFVDRRIRAANAPVLSAAESARSELSRGRQELLGELEQRFQQMAFDLATASRAHAESVSYVAAVLARLEHQLGGEIRVLGEQLAASTAGRRDSAASDPYTVRALSPLERGARILVIEPGLDFAPVSLAALGYHVTVLGEQPYPMTHGNLDVVVGSVGDLRTSRYDGLVLGAETAERVEQALARRDELLGARGLLVLRLAREAARAADRLEGFEVIDRSVATSNSNGGWAIDGEAEPGVLLVTARLT
jgi:hypothetical protein